jgi:hypothetical protein
MPSKEEPMDEQKTTLAEDEILTVGNEETSPTTDDADGDDTDTTDGDSSDADADDSDSDAA